jgi:hypothetical protein
MRFVGRKAGRGTFHKVLAERLTVVNLVSMACADAETREVLVEVDKQHLRAHRVDASRCDVHPQASTKVSGYAPDAQDGILKRDRQGKRS